MDIKHHHCGKSSEAFLDKAAILKELRVLPGQVILDAGCGNGYMAKAFAQALDHTGKVYAVDIDAEAIAKLRLETAGSNLEATTEDITAITSIPESSVDLIYMSTVFHMFSREQARVFQKDITRFLKPGGIYAIVEMKKESLPVGPPPDIKYSPAELKEVINLIPQVTIAIGEYCYLQTFQKKISLQNIPNV